MNQRASGVAEPGPDSRLAEAVVARAGILQGVSPQAAADLIRPASARRVPARAAHLLHRRPRRPALHRDHREGEDRPPVGGRPREAADHHGPVRHVGRVVDIRPGTSNGDRDGHHHGLSGDDGPRRAGFVDRQPAGDHRAAAARTRSAAATHQRPADGFDLHRRAGPGREGTAQDGTEVRDDATGRAR